jgi:hypothetical protein
MACSHLVSFSVNPRVFVTPPAQRLDKADAVAHTA